MGPTKNKTGQIQVGVSPPMGSNQPFHIGHHKEHAETDTGHRDAQGKTAFSFKPSGKKGGVGNKAQKAYGAAGQNAVGELKLPQILRPAGQGQCDGEKNRSQGNDDSRSHAILEITSAVPHQSLGKDKKGKYAGCFSPGPSEFPDDGNDEYGKRIPYPEGDAQGDKCHKKDNPAIVYGRFNPVLRFRIHN